MNDVVYSVRQWIDDASQRLKAHSDQPEQEAKWLAEFVLKLDGTELLLAFDSIPSDHQLSQLAAFLQEREQGTPLAYVLGEWSFYGLTLKVTPQTLIPRPETEVLVDHLLTGYYRQPKSFRVLDLGTGSGAIALAIAKERSDAKVIALDASPQAIAVAYQNARQHALKNVSFLVSRWCKALSSDRIFDVIVSNPPYLSQNDPHLSGSIAYEPSQALVAGETGMEDLETIALQAKLRLKHNGLLLLEHGFDQAPELRAMLKDKGYEQIQTVRDLAGHERVTQAIWP